MKGYVCYKCGSQEPTHKCTGDVASGSLQPAGSAYPMGVDQDALQHGSLMPDLLQLDNETKIKFCNAWHALCRHYTVCKQCQVYLIEGYDDLCAVGKHLVAKELCYADCRVEITPNSVLGKSHEIPPQKP